MKKRYARKYDWNSYRLKNRSPVQTAEGNRRKRRIAPEFKRYVYQNFTGSEPAAIIWLLESFVRGANYIDVKEGDAVWVIAAYLETAPKEMVFNLVGTN